MVVTEGDERMKEIEEEIMGLLKSAEKELRSEGLEPDILLAGPGFLEGGGEVVKKLGLKVYVIDELEYDAVLADSRYVGQVRKATKRISIEPMILKDRIWDEMVNI